MPLTTYLVGLTLLATGPTPAEARPADVRRAVERALPFLEREGVAWREERKCLSCHTGAFLVWSYREAGRRGFAIDAGKLADWTDWALAFAGSDASPDTLAQVLLAVPASATTGKQAGLRAAAAGFLLQKQAGGFWKPGMFWRAGGQLPTQKRPPREGDEVTTLWTVLALAAEGGRDVPAARDRARAWAKEAGPAETNELLALRLVIERRFGEPARAGGLLEELLGRQSADGGWGWRKDAKASDALGTGQALYALRVAGVGPADPAIRRAQAFLLGAQREDGSWPAESRWYSGSQDEKHLRNADPIYAFWGSAWATIGLLHTLPEAGASGP
jgi:squalene-hopene/tetraprenyl-beta-curcumene cyclase